MKRDEILKEAEKCICGQREQDYGQPENNFADIANFGRFIEELILLQKMLQL